MVRLGSLLLAIALLTVLAQGPYEQVLAKPAGEPWTHARLTQESEIIVLGTLASSKDSQPARLREIAQERLQQEVATTIHVEAVLKGVYGLPELVMLHSRLKTYGELGEAATETSSQLEKLIARPETPVVIINGPGLIKWPSSDKESLQGKPVYLLFLKRGPDNTFVPTSGQEEARESAALLKRFF